VFEELLKISACVEAECVGEGGKEEGRAELTVSQTST